MANPCGQTRCEGLSCKSVSHIDIETTENFRGESSYIFGDQVIQTWVVGIPNVDFRKRTSTQNLDDNEDRGFSGRPRKRLLLVEARGLMLVND